MAKVYDEMGEYTEDIAKCEAERKGALRDVDSGSGFAPNPEPVVGICHDCKYYSFVSDDMYQIVLSRCNKFNTGIGKRIQFCTNYEQRGGLTIHEMYELATILDFDNLPDKQIKGFGAK